MTDEQENDQVVHLIDDMINAVKDEPSKLNDYFIWKGEKLLPIQIAASEGDLDFLKYCVESGANIDTGIETPICYSCKNNHLQCVQYLVEKECNYRFRDDLPFKYAVTYYNMDIVKYLLSLGIDPNIEPVNSILSTVVLHHHLEMTKFLLKYINNVNFYDIIC